MTAAEVERVARVAVDVWRRVPVGASDWAYLMNKSVMWLAEAVDRLDEERKHG